MLRLPVFNAIDSGAETSDPGWSIDDLAYQRDSFSGTWAEGSLALRVGIHVTTNDAPPVVGVVPDRTEVPRGGTVRLTAEASDPDGGTVAYAWSAGSGTFDRTDAATAVWTAPNATGNVDVRVTVTDDEGDTADATATIAVGNQPPTVSIRAAKTEVGRGGTVRLAAEATDPDGGALTYAWSADTGTFDRTDAAMAVWTAPDMAGNANLRVTVTDDEALAADATARIAVTSQRLSVSIGADRTEVPRGGTVSLTTEVNNPDDDTLTYAWTAGSGTFDRADAATAVWTAPDMAGEVDLRLTVTGDGNRTADDTLRIAVSNRPPTVSIAADRTEVPGGGTVRLTATAHDPDGDTLTYAWSASAGSFIGATGGARARWRAPPVAGSSTLSVEITDGLDGRASASLVLEVANAATPRAWLARFGGTVAEQAIAAVEARMRAPRAPGAEATLGGRRIAPGPALDAGDAERGPGPASRATTGRALLPGSSFSLTAAKAGGTGGTVSLWGRGAATRFDGREGPMTLDGEVASGWVGADWSRGPTAAGLILGHSRGEGGWRPDAGGPGSGSEVSATLTGFYPWGRHALGERVEVWGVAGYGEGTLTLTREDRSAVRTDLDLAMGAVGLRGVAAEAPETGGPEIAIKTDAMAVRATTAKLRDLPAAEADATRLRLGIESLWPLRLDDGRVLTPSLEFGMRHDGGDAETGFGADIGAGIAWSDPRRGLSAEVRGRGLLTHRARGFRERGLSGSLSFDPRPDSRRGLSLTLSQTVGAASTGGMDALLRRRAMGALGDGGDPGNRRFEMRLGYGFSALGDRFTSTPEVGVGFSNRSRDYSLGWRRVRENRGGETGTLELALEARRRETGNAAPEAAEHAVGLRLTARY